MSLFCIFARDDRCRESENEREHMENEMTPTYLLK